mmetsp:Transcript_28489/g.51514  ORF Transcript_28489/g.51514 Transcript_28489/m.51514 type:complete len:183 (-) Transcript_28489:103-651(-)
MLLAEPPRCVTSVSPSDRGLQRAARTAFLQPSRGGLGTSTPGALLAACAAVSMHSWGRARRKACRRAEEEHREPDIKTIETMMKFSNQYAKVSKTNYCADKSVPAVVIVGLALHKETLGAPLCPCRHYEDKEKEVKDGYWNCPCVPMRERKECHCMLFLTDDNPFTSDCSHIDLEEILKMKG